MSDTDATIRPPLTPEEWASRRLYREHIGTDYVEDYVEVVSSGAHLSVRGDGSFVGADRHGLAALVLDGQTFGFSHEDVANLNAMPDGTGYASIDDPVWYASLIARIAALLPPETP